MKISSSNRVHTTLISCVINNRLYHYFTCIMQMYLYLLVCVRSSGLKNTYFIVSMTVCSLTPHIYLVGSATFQNNLSLYSYGPYGGALLINMMSTPADSENIYCEFKAGKHSFRCFYVFICFIFKSKIYAI